MFLLVIHFKFCPPPVENIIWTPAPATSYGLVLKFLFPSGKDPLNLRDPRIVGSAGAVVMPLHFSRPFLTIPNF